MRALPFEVVAADGTRLRGESWPGGPDWVVMAHDYGNDLDCWRPLVGPLGAAGYSVATIDLRGHGASDGTADEGSISDDLAALLAQARRDSSGLLVLIAAGEAAAAALSPSLEPRPDALVLFSPSPHGQSGADLRGDGTVKMFFVGAMGPEADRIARDLRNRSIGHAGVISFPTVTQGADLLQEPWRTHVIEQVIGFVEQARSTAQKGERL
jgi:alpha-beta hydrolase superfamily lysophospholipase